MANDTKTDVIHVILRTNPNLRTVVDWTCPECGHRNIGQLWFGRDRYFCIACGADFDIKGTAEVPQ